MEIKMDLISEDKINSMGSMEKLRFILDGVKSGNIVILEGGLSSEEQMKLIELTMTEINDDFPGIEISGYPAKRSLLNLRRKRRLTVVGPAKVMRTIKKDKDLIRAVVSAV
ncbi:MAG: OapB/ArvB family protein [Candidatus Methanospirareceae archaeon]